MRVAAIRDHTRSARVARRVRAVLEPYKALDARELMSGVDDTELDDLQRHGPGLRPARLAGPGGALAWMRTQLRTQLTRRRDWREESYRPGMRVDPGRRGAAAIGIAALVAVVIAGGWVALDRPHAAAVTAVGATARVPTATAGSNPSAAATGSANAAASANAPPAGNATASTTARMVVVDVVGKVSRPGVYSLPAGSRVAAALTAAGGVLPGVDLSTLNLARVVSDGEQIAVAVPGAPAPVAAGSAGAGGAAASGPIDLNTATATELDALPGVGPVLAQHIVDWRTAHGSFSSVDQLREVSGIGDAT